MKLGLSDIQQCPRIAYPMKNCHILHSSECLNESITNIDWCVTFSRTDVSVQCHPYQNSNRIFVEIFKKMQRAKKATFMHNKAGVLIRPDSKTCGIDTRINQ